MVAVASCFTAKGIMNNHRNLHQNLKPSLRWLKPGHGCVFRHDDDKADEDDKFCVEESNI